MPLQLRFNAILLLVAISLTLNAVSAEEPIPDRIEFNRDIRPILSDVCFQCHGPDAAQRKAELRLDTESGALSQLTDGRAAIIAGKPDESELVRRIRSNDANLVMPPPEFERRLSSRHIALLSRWIEQGAKWESPWSFVKPVRIIPPKVNSRGDGFWYPSSNARRPVPTELNEACHLS